LHNEKAYAALAAYLCGGRLPHAILLEGPRGTGKTSFAMEIAGGALCTAPPEERPCGVCRDCVKVGKGIHPDVLVYESEGGSQSFHVDAVRAVRQEAYVRPNEGSCKVLILRNVHTMTIQAENALLKIIEEPPSGVVFILTCENKAALLETILSRVTTIALAQLTAGQCTQALTQLRPELAPADCESAAAQAAGSVGGALELLDAEEKSGREDNLSIKILTALCLGSELEALALLSPYEKDKEQLVRLLTSMALEVRELLRVESVSHPDRQRLRTRIPPLQLMQILVIIEEIAGAVSQNVNRLLLLTDLCARIKLVI